MDIAINKKLNSNTLKLILSLLMVLDHIQYIPNLLSYKIQISLHMLTRIVAYSFAFFSIEGFKYTSNRKKYNARLFIFAFIMQITNYIINHTFLEGSSLKIENNIIMTFALGILVLNIIENEIKIKGVIANIILSSVFLALFFTEGGVLIIPYMLLTYYIEKEYKNKKVLYLGYIMLSVVFLVIVLLGSPNPVITFIKGDWCAAISIITIFLYNGRRGNKNIITKYYFYIFYPLHIYIIYSIAYLLG